MIVSKQELTQLVKEELSAVLSEQTSVVPLRTPSGDVYAYQSGLDPIEDYARSQVLSSLRPTWEDVVTGGWRGIELPKEEDVALAWESAKASAEADYPYGIPVVHPRRQREAPAQHWFDANLAGEKAPAMSEENYQHLVDLWRNLIDAPDEGEEEVSQPFSPHVTGQGGGGLGEITPAFRKWFTQPLSLYESQLKQLIREELDVLKEKGQ